MKKVLAVVAVIAVVCVAGAAFAQPKAREQGRRMPPQMMQAQPGQHIDQRQGEQVVQNMPNPHVDQRNNPKFAGESEYQPKGRGEGKGRPEMPGDFGGQGRKCGCGRGRGNGRMMFAPDMPEEIKAKAVEAAKLRIDLDAALSAKPINKAKAMEIFSAIQKAEQEVKAWRFSKRIEQIEAFRKQMELNRNVPPAPAPAPAEKPEAPAPAPEAAK